MTGAQDLKPYNVLFISSGNAGRSAMAEAILNRDGGGRFKAFSAGTEPSGELHSLAVETLVAEGYSIEGLRAKNVSDFLGPDAPKMDFIFTLSDETAGEIAPEWPGNPVTAHWAIENPALVDGSPIARERAFEQAFKYTRNRVRAFAALPLGTLDRLALHSQLAQIGRATPEADKLAG